MPHIHYCLSTLERFVGKRIGVTAWETISQDQINAFADCTGDHQWIHVDVPRAQRESPFGGTIAHGFLTLSLIAKFGMSLGVVPSDAKAAFNYGLDKVRFIAPVKVGSRVRCEVTLQEVREQGAGRWLMKTCNTVEVEAQDKPALIAELLIVLIA